MGLCLDLGREVVTSSVTVTAAGGIQTFTVSAPSGKKAVGAGADFGTTQNIDWRKVAASYPDANGNWVFKLVADNSVSYGVTLYAVFVNV